jgi:ABC-type glycerol-3-phosphate transport system substrate-binding protein
MRAGRLVLVALALLLACPGRKPPQGVRRIVYWEKWTGFEGEAIDRAVESFNALERDKAATEKGYVPVEVQKVTVSRIEQKLLVAIAGGNPPDVAGTYDSTIAAYADKGALVDLGPLADRYGIRRGDYIEHFYDLGVHRGTLWALPTAPASTALHYNKRLLREAGLDADAPPTTLEQLDQWAERLTRWEVTLPDGTKEVRTGQAPDVPADRKRLLQVGFLPSNPGWWPWSWPYFFGGGLVDDAGRITADAPENIRAFEWVASYSKKLGVDAVNRFRSGFGNFSSPQNPFLSGRIAMQIQGVWMYNFISRYAPGMDWGAAPFPHPADRPDRARTTVAESDMIVIPRASRHVEEAFAFVRYLSSQQGMEILCLGQRKFSPLKSVSERFWREHPNPYIRMFRDLAMTGNAIAVPRLGIWNEYNREIVAAADAIGNLAPVPGVLGALEETIAARNKIASVRRRP